MSFPTLTLIRIYRCDNGLKVKVNGNWVQGAAGHPDFACWTEHDPALSEQIDITHLLKPVGKTSVHIECWNGPTTYAGQVNSWHFHWEIVKATPHQPDVVLYTHPETSSGGKTDRPDQMIHSRDGQV